MTIMTKEDLMKLEEYYYLVGCRSWYPFPKELKAKILDFYGEEPFPNSWTEQDIHEGARKIIKEYFKKKSSKLS